ncbi:MAG: bifunctional 3,4-dihydroxy-2-butanone-4-phosphate synthase/GTP cyclohydrolase II [Limnothrix sp. BL-A-16]|jgi:3,4-dihydroxy 2-butanone 4-phosphate synthase/GTP cyclohydrolase II
MTHHTVPQSVPAFVFDTIPAILADLKAGRPVVIVDDENRENEGDIIYAAEKVTADAVNFMATEARGLICLAMTGDRLDALELPLMVTNNTDSNQTAFTVSIDASPALGVSTGISAEDRAKTIQVAIDPRTRPEDLRRPGHIFPLRSREGGVLKRAGHTEAAVDLARLAGLYPAGVICEIQNPDGSMARLPQLIDYAQRYDLKIATIADLISYRLQHERFVIRETVTKLPTEFGLFEIYGYRNEIDGSDHVAIVKGDPASFHDRPVLVRVHSECLTGDALGSLRCDCRSQLIAALKMIEQADEGVVVYLRQEGRGIGLINKLKAYSLQDLGFDTVEANEKLGFPADLRDYGVGAQILNDLGISQVRLITNNPRKIAGVRGYGLEVVDRVPLLIESNSFNTRYLTTKAAKLGHLLLQTYLVTLALHWTDHPTTSEAYERLAQLRQLVSDRDLRLREEARPVAVALFGNPALIVHLGFDQSNLAMAGWYREPGHPYLEAIAQLLDQVADWQAVQRLEFLVSEGGDPMAGLQVKLDRLTYKLSSGHRPSTICQDVESQQIYSFLR